EAALEARGSENTLVTILLKHRLAGCEIFGSGGENVLGGHLLRRPRRGGTWKWLGGPRFFTNQLALLHSARLHLQQRDSDHAIEQEQVRCLRADCHGGPVLTGE